MAKVSAEKSGATVPSNTNLLQGLALHSMQWGAWSSGMASSKALQAHLERVGMGTLHPVAGINALGSVLASLSSAGDLTYSLEPSRKAGHAHS